MERDIPIYLNGFRIKKNIIPQQVFKFKLCFVSEDESRRYKIIKGKYLGVPITPVEQPEVEVIAWDKPFDDGVENFTVLFLEDLPTNKQEELVYFYMRRVIEIEKILQKYLPLPEKKYHNDTLVIPNVKTLSVKKINSDFYLFFDIGYRIRSIKNIYELAKEGKISYSDLVGKELIYDPYGNRKGERKVITVTKVEENPPKEIVKETYEYLKNKYGIKVLLNGVPLVYMHFGKSSRESYPTFPQLCYLEKRDFLNKLIIPNEKRKSIIQNVVSKIDFLENYPLCLKGKEYKNPQYIVRINNGKLKKVNTLKETIKYPAFYVPKILRGKEVAIFVLIDKRLPQGEVEKFLKNQISKEKYLKLQKEDNIFRFKTIKPSKEKLTFKVDFERFTLPIKILERINNFPLSIALCISKEMLQGNYDKIKRKLFTNNILSQFVIYEKWKNSAEYISQTLAFDIYSKLGVRLFTLAEKLPYDLIIGVDVGNDRFNRRSKAGGVTVFSSQGIIKTMFPLFVETGGERIDFLDELLEFMVEGLNIKNKKILLLRDGNIYSKEIESLISSTLLSERMLTIDVVNVKKNHSFRILSNSGRRGVVINENVGILLPHSAIGARSILVDMAFTIKNGTFKKLPITHSLLSVLYKLTKVNFSTIFREDIMFRLPAPLHYADTFVKALGRGWNINESLLMTGCLYFL